MTTRSAMVGANSSCASCSAAASPKSMKITCRPESSSVSGPNIGCSEVTRQPALTSASRPARSGVFKRPQIEDQAARRALRQLSSSCAVALKGVASTMRSQSRG